MAKAKKATKRKPAKKGATKRRAPKKATKRRAPKKGASHHVERAHASTMRALGSVKKSDLEALKRLERAVEHALENARSARE